MKKSPMLLGSGWAKPEERMNGSESGKRRNPDPEKWSRTVVAKRCPMREQDD
jgi:hypothetical protein